MHLRAVALRRHEHESQLFLLRPIARGEQDAERVIVEERRLAQVGDEVDPLVEQESKLALEPAGGLRIVLAEQRDHRNRGVMAVQGD